MNPILLRALLAALPLLGVTLGAKSGFVYGWVGASIFILTTSIFFMLRPALPRLAHRLSFLLLLLVLGVIGQELLSLSPLLLASLLFLPSPEFLHLPGRIGEMAKKMFLTGFSFWGFLAGHGILSGLLGSGAGIRFFQLPAGSYFLLVLVLVFLRKK